MFDVACKCQAQRQLIAPTILFLASKIEEEPIKLRHIVNNCLDKWDPAADKWIVDPNNKEVCNSAIVELISELPSTITRVPSLGTRNSFGRRDGT